MLECPLYVNDGMCWTVMYAGGFWLRCACRCVFVWWQIVGERDWLSGRECIVYVAVVADWSATSGVGVWLSDRSGVCVRVRMRVLLRCACGR